MNIEPAMARRLWTVFEPYHAMLYFVPEARAVYAAAGLEGFWTGYFASRAAALGRVPAPVVRLRARPSPSTLPVATDSI